MKAVKEMARTKVQLDTSREVENRLGNTSSENSNNSVLGNQLSVIQRAYIYRYIDCEILTCTPKTTLCGPLIQGFLKISVRHRPVVLLNSKFFDVLTPFGGTSNV